MWRNKLSRQLIIGWTLMLCVALVGGEARAQKKKPLPTGTPVLWRRGAIAARDLFAGPGGDALRPNLSRVIFVEDDDGGTSEKYRIRDAAGREWIAKIGREAQSETAAVRLVWALGYATEINYLVPTLTIPGKGEFENARLEARSKDVKRLEDWKWKDNPFSNTNELQGLKIMMALLNNWDLKDDNNKILLTRSGGRNELQYVISDLGATFGKTGDLPLLWRVTRSRNEPGDYEDAKFISKVKDNRVEFDYNGKMRELFDNITIEQGRWLAALLTQLSEKQISDAFRAANYTPEEVATLTAAFQRRVSELSLAVSAQTATE